MPINHHTNASMGQAWARWQRILNQSWPQRDDTGPHARDIREGTERTPAEARVHWVRDGLEILPGLVTRRANGCVFVELNDPRCAIRGVWLSETDVRPRQITSDDAETP